MSSGRSQGAITYPPSKKPKHSLSAYSSDHSSHNRENIPTYAKGTYQLPTSFPFKESRPGSNPCQSPRLIVSQQDFSVSANQDWRHVSTTSTYQENNDSGHFIFDPGYWHSVSLQNIESMDNLAGTTAFIQGQAQHSSSFSNQSSTGTFNMLSTPNNSFESMMSSQTEEQTSEATLGSSIPYFNNVSAGVSFLSRNASPSSRLKADDLLNSWDSEIMLNEPKIEYDPSQSNIQNLSGLDLVRPETPSPCNKLLPQIPSKLVDYLTYTKYLERPALMLSKSFHVSEDVTLEHSRSDGRAQWQLALSPREDLPRKLERRYGPSKSSIPRQHKSGCRTGPLEPENAKKVLEMRRRRACWSCWLSKVPCSMEDECYRCRNNHPSLFRGTICSRRKLVDYTDVFFPAVLVAHLQQAKLENMIQDETASFTDTTIKINISSGTLYPPMELTLRPFISSNNDFLSVELLDEDCNGRLIAVRKYAPPIGLPAGDVILLKKKCLQHIKGIVASGFNQQEYGMRKEPDICWRILEAIDRFRKSSSRSNVTSILQKALMLHAMHAFMGRSLTIVNVEEFSTSFTTLHDRDVAYDFEIPPPLLNREIKHVMNSLLHETTEQFLSQLEKELRTKSKAAWAPCFCAIVILSMCAEDLQIALDGFTVYTQSHSTRKSILLRSDSLALARQLDDRLLADCKALFHGIYKSRKRPTGLKGEMGFNPLRDGLDVDGDDKLEQEVHDLVEDIHEILGIYGHDMIDLAKEPSFSDGDDLMDSHMDFRESNSGRLVSRFLRSFLETSD